MDSPLQRGLGYFCQALGPWPAPLIILAMIPFAILGLAGKKISEWLQDLQA